MARQPKASIILRTKNEAAFIALTLDRIFEQNFPDFEVIVVDSGSTDRTLEIASEYNVKFVQLQPEEFTYGKALNAGFREGEGEFFISVSAHALPLDRDWLSNILAPFEYPRVAGVAGKALPHMDCNPFDRRGLLRRFGTDRKFLHYNSEITFSNANSAVRRCVWEEEPFDEELPYSEDIKWSRNMMEKGWQFVYEPKATVYHSHDETPRQLFERFYNESKARALLDHSKKRFGAQSLLWDFIAGSFYDIWTALFRHRSFKWAGFAPKRRYWINLGRYFGSRGMDRNYEKNPLSLLLLRIVLIFIRYINSMLERLAPYLVALTNKHTEILHPKELLEQTAGEDWFVKYFTDSERILDIGCGQGQNLLKLSEVVKHVYGLERDGKAIYAANFLIRWREVNNISLVAANYLCIPFYDNIFDGIMALDFLPMIEKREEFFVEVLRMLKPRGQLIISVPKSDTPWKSIQKRAGLPVGFEHGVSVGYMKEEIEREFGRYGFTLSAVHPDAIDTPLNPLIDVVGGVSLGAYKRLLDWRYKKALQFPDRSSALRLVFTKANPK